MQKLLGREGKVTGFHIRLVHPDRVGETGRVQSQLAAMFPQMSFVEASEVAQDALVLRLLRAIVWSSSSIAMGMAFMAVLGIGLGLACLRWIARHPRLGGLFQPEVTAGLVLEGAMMAMAVGLLAGLYPAWRATRLSPMDLLRSE